MRFVLTLSLSLLLSVAAFAASLTVKVTDPDAAVVDGARVTVYADGSQSIVAVQQTNAEGLASFSGLADAKYRVEVLAPGFAPQSAGAGADQTITLALKLAVRSETVIVSAAQTPLPVGQTDAPASVLDSPTLALMQPVTANDALRFLPGAIINGTGRRGALSSLFVRGGESRYNKVLIDGVNVNDPGGTFDWGDVSLQQAGRLEFVRGAESTLYGSDAMTSVVQVFSATGNSRTPELRFGAEGGTFSTARGYASLAGAWNRFDYNVFGEQLNTEGQGINDAFSSSSQGANLGVALTDKIGLRFRTRHTNTRSGVQGIWNFNGVPLLSPEPEEYARTNNFLASADITIAAPGRWQHRISGFEYNHRRVDVDRTSDPGRVTPLFGNIDFPFDSAAFINRAGFSYQGEYSPRGWARSTFGLEYENENGLVGSRPTLTRGVRNNFAVFGQQFVNWKRLTFVAGLRAVHNGSFGNRAVPRATLNYLAWKGNGFFSGTRLRAAYGEGIKEPRLEETFGIGAFFIDPNLTLRAERNRSLEAGVSQGLWQNKASFTANYYNNLFRDQIAFFFDPVTFKSNYLNLNKALAHGAEFEFHVRPRQRISLDTSYNYLSTQILKSPTAFDPLLAEGAPLLRRPKHSGTLLFNYIGNKWGGNLGGSFVGRRSDSDFLGLLPPITHAAGYARFDVGAWYALNKYATAYVNVENLLNRKYEEAAGFPALKANFRAGVRFRIGGDR